MDTIEITPATAAQVHRTRGGKTIVISDDVQNVARDLREIDESLRLHYDPHQDIYVIRQHIRNEDGSEEEKLVTTAQDLDQRIVHRVREIASPGYDYAGEMERLDREADRRRDREFAERMGPKAERLAHALRKDLGDTSRAFVPKGV